MLDFGGYQTGVLVVFSRPFGAGSLSPILPTQPDLSKLAFFLFRSIGLDGVWGSVYFGRMERAT